MTSRCSGRSGPQFKTGPAINILGPESSGFTVHEEASSYATCVGVEINGLLGRVSTKPRRRRKLRLALRWLASRPLVLRQQVERVIEHAMFVVLLNRPLLSLPSGESTTSFGRATETNPSSGARQLKGLGCQAYPCRPNFATLLVGPLYAHCLLNPISAAPQ